MEKVITTSCKIEYKHTFMVVDFGNKSNYEIILGFPFMPQLKMIQDWGYNYIYLRYAHATTCIYLKDHSYKNVVHPPVIDKVLIARLEDLVPSWLVNGHPLWLSEVINNGKEDNDVSSKDYILNPFLEHVFETHDW